MPDRSIPSHPAGRPFAVSRGVFCKQVDRTILLDKAANTYHPYWVSIIPSFWGRSEDGNVKLPRPEVRLGDEIIVEGDEVVILYLGGNYQLPIVLGASRKFGTNTAGLPYDHSADPTDPLANKLRGRLRWLDEVTGDKAAAPPEARWSVHETVPGVVQLLTSVYTEVGHVVPLADRQYAMRADSFLTDLLASLTEIIAAFAALGVALPATTTLQTNVSTSIAAGAPYRSTSVKVE
jgi:hypothetical protein